MKQIAIFLFVLLSACSLQTTSEPTPVPKIARIVTIIATETSLPTSTATPAHTRTATATWTATATLPPPPTQTFTPTPVPTRDIFALSDMVGNTRYIPRAQILNLRVPAPGAISPTLFGINYWKGRFNRPIRRALAPLNFTVMRWGGGNYEGEPLNLSDLDQFIGEARKSNVEPLVQVPFWNRTPESAAQLVRYLNVEKKYDVRFWSISNEPDKNLRTGSRDKYIVGFRAFRDAMKAVDPRILFFGPELATEYDLNDPAHDWLTPFLKANGDIVDVVSLHRYPFGGNVRTTGKIFGDALGTAQRADELRGHIRSVTGRDIPLAFTEINMSHNWETDGEGSSAGFGAGMWLAETIGQMAEAGVTMVNVWSAYGNNSMALITPNIQDPRPTYYALRAYANYGDRIVPLASHVPNVTAHASLNSRTNATDIVFVNRGLKPMKFEIVFNSNTEQVEGAVYLDRGSLAKMPFNLPAESISSITLDDHFQVIETVIYSRAMFTAGKAAKITTAQP